MEFDRTESSHTEGKIEEATMRLQIGTVATVFEHTKKNDKSNFECNVILRDEEKERRRVKIMTPRKDEIHVPAKGDKVVVGFLDGETEDPIILGNYYNIRDRPPLGKEGMYRLRRGNLYFESDKEGNYARITKKRDDEGDAGVPAFKIELDDSGNNPVLKMARDDDEDENTDYAVGLEDEGPRAFVEADTNDDGTPEALLEIDESSNSLIVKVTGEEAPMGLRLDLSTGKFKLRDGGGYGIESDGAGNFTWYHKSVDFKEGSTMSGW